MDNTETRRQAKILTREEKKQVLFSLKETQLHGNLKKLLEKMQENYNIEITHGMNELGKDLVIIKKDKMDIEAIAVVVKMGKISGKTSGEIDEIKNKTEKIFKHKHEMKDVVSQVKQAMSHPAES